MTHSETKFHLNCWIGNSRTRYQLWETIVDTARRQALKAYVDGQGAWTFSWRMDEVAPSRTMIDALMLHVCKQMGVDGSQLTYDYIE